MAIVDWVDVTTVTHRAIMPRIVDVLYKSNPTFYHLYKKGYKLDGGRFISFSLLTARPQGGAYRGTATLNNAQVKQLTEAQLDWKQYYEPCTVDGTTQLLNAGANKIVSIVSAYMENTRRALEEDLGKDLWLGTTGNTNSSNSNSNSSEQLDGLDVAIDDGTNSANYAQLAHATVTGWKANYLDNASAQISLATLQTAYGNCVFGQSHPDLIVMPQTQFNEVWNKVQPAQRFGDGGGETGIGFPYITFNQAKILVDQYVNSNANTGTNGAIYFLNTEFMDLVVHQDQDFYWTGWMQPTNQNAKISYIFWAGNPAVYGPRYFEKIVNVG